MRWPSLSTVLAALPTIALVAAVAAGVGWVRSLQGARDGAARERDEARISAADLAVARQADRRALEESARNQAMLRDQAARLRRAEPGARPVVVLHGDTGPLAPSEPAPGGVLLRDSDRPSIVSEVQVWRTPGGAAALLGASRLELDGRVLLAGEWRRELSRAEIDRLAPQPGLGLALQLDARRRLRAGLALPPWRPWGSHQVEAAILSPPVPVDGSPVRVDLREISAFLVVR